MRAASDTPVTRSTRSGQYAAEMRSASSNPSVRRAMYSSSIRCSRTSTCSRPLASAESEPGRSCRCFVAHCAVGVRRGSTTISVPPFRCCCFEVPHDRRHRLGDVAADEQDDAGVRDVGERKRQPAIETEGLDRGGRGRRHAEAAVVVDVRRAERDARELAEQYAFSFVSDPPPKTPTASGPCCRCTSWKRSAICVESRFPRRGHETS